MWISPVLIVLGLMGLFFGFQQFFKEKDYLAFGPIIIGLLLFGLGFGGMMSN